MSELLLEKSGANYFGFETIDDAGKKRRDENVVRGNGLLTLSQTQLTFVRDAPPVEIVVPLELVEWIKTGRSHNARSFGFLPILKVAFRTATETRILGVCIGTQAETDEWVEALESLLAPAPA